MTPSLRVAHLFRPGPHSEPGFLACASETDDPILRGGAEIRIIVDQQIPINVQVVCQLSQVRGGSNEDARFDHASEHREAIQSAVAAALCRRGPKAVAIS